VLDQMMPKRSGFLVMEGLKRGKQRTDPPRVIMITGNLGSRHKVYAESLGVDVYLNKPFHMERLVESVLKLLGAPPPPPT
jgi:DNA-binding response OmpR family regulator